jgi:hypothetical protein
MTGCEVRTMDLIFLLLAGLVVVAGMTTAWRVWHGDWD